MSERDASKEQPLFMSSSDDETEEIYAKKLRPNINNGMADISMEEPLGEGSTLGEFEDEPPKSSPRSDPATLTDDGLEAEASTSNAHALSSSEIRPQKRRRASYEEKINAWSTTKGTGYIKNGDPILIERETLQDDRSFSKDAAKKGKGKQMTLNNLFKIRASATKKTKSNIIVRLTNARGFEFGRLPTSVSSWVSKLMDFGIIDFTGSRMIDCPDKLHLGADLLVSISISMLPSAFKRYKADLTSSSSFESKTWFNEGQETEEEEMLRNRKASLQDLFEKLDLKPKAGNNGVLDKENVTPAQVQAAGGSLPVANEHSISEGGKAGERASDDNDEEELSESDLHAIYKRAQAYDADMGEMDPSDSFALQLRPYQKQALLWMYSRETGAASARKSNSMHPLWTEYIFPPEQDSDGSIDLTAEEQPFYYNCHSGELSLDFPRSENSCRGGILADGEYFPLGMGKTIMLSSLIHTNRGEKPNEDISGEEIHQSAKQKQLRLDVAFRPIPKSKPLRKSKATLIVAPASLLAQWANEVQKSSADGTVNVLVWHGQSRDDLESMIDSTVDVTDVVITSYGTVASEYSRLERSAKSVPMYDIEWFRIVLDEAHNIKSRASKSARAVFELKSPRRWTLTGTPIVNRLEDLYSLLRFVEFAPWSDYSFFRSVVTLPFLNREPKAIEVVQVILESVLLRREKTMRDRDGNMIVQLPDKEVKHEYLEFTPLERHIYDSLYQDAKIDFDRLNERGLVGKKYTHILAMLMKLRRAVLHPSFVISENEEEPAGDSHVDIKQLVKQASKTGSSDDKNDNYARDVLSKLSSVSEEECPICMDIMEEPMLIPNCMHKCCKDCILAFLHTRTEKGEEGACPTCRRGPVKAEELLEIVRRRKDRGTSIGIAPEGENEEDAATDLRYLSPVVELRRNDFKSSTKLNALSQHLRRLRDQDPCFRAIVFSQFTSFLDLIETVLEREQLQWYRLDGSIEIKKRHKAIMEFNQASRTPKVFLLSLKVGGVGLNLTTANHVFMMDCWWNEAIEQQAIDRVHRIGQERTVFVTHFIISNTIEGRILQIQKRKTAIIKEAFKGQGETDSDTVENLKIMFGED